MAEKRTSDSVPATPVAAATVMLVRDSPEGVEVFLMERSGFGAFGGLHVFPGGKIDAMDAEARWTDLAEGVEPTTANATLGLESGGLDYWVATIRECFEEAGVLLATRADGRLLPLTDPDRRARFAAWRARLNGGEKGAFEAMCKEESLRLATDRLAYVSHWITPVTERKRFDTRFFLARAPSKQEALHDGFETVESAWIRPDSALDRWKRGDLNLISPTFTNLQGLVGYDSTESLLRAKRAVDPATIPVILPKVRPREGGDFDEEIAEVGRGGRLFEEGR
ncbi:MAG: NUDIX hydrolase [Deltaproteobacteria bacterium]|nr:NUDIX hydrolase [Deltaproteobacteria bacterium]